MKKERVNFITLPIVIAALAAFAGLCAAGENASGYSYGDSAARNEACLVCHADAAKVKPAFFVDRARYAHTTHANISCPTCHGGSAVTHPAAGSAKADCRACHQAESEEYASGIHAGKTGCAGCHDPHKVKTPVEISGEEINKICSGCHNGFEMTAKHSEWLPQADLHLRMLPCITCHTASPDYYLSLYVVKGKDGSRFGRPELASYDDLKRLAGGKEVVSLIDTNGDRTVSIDELRAFNKDPSHRFLRLQGMMTPEVASHKFEILDDRRNCTFCHASGTPHMQKSYLSLPQAGGTFQRIAVQRGPVLDVVYSTPDFYLMGSTKSSRMNIVGLAIICGGLIMPVGHGTLRFLTRKNRKEEEEP
ncbi:cytochrome c [Geomonas sp. Red276]